MSRADRKEVWLGHKVPWGCGGIRRSPEVGPLLRLGRKPPQVWRPPDVCPGSQNRVGGEEDEAESVETVFAQARDAECNAEELLLVDDQN